jgi:hypothetical protein
MMCGWETQEETQTREGIRSSHRIVGISGISLGIKLVRLLFELAEGKSSVDGYQSFNSFINSAPLFPRL